MNAFQKQQKSTTPFLSPLARSLITFYRNRGHYLAASIAYFTTVSFIPVLFVLLSAAGWILKINDRLQQKIITYFHGLIPQWEETFEISTQFLQDHAGTISVISLGLFFLTARTLLGSINYAFDTVLNQDSYKSFWKLLLDTILVFSAFLLFVSITVIWNIGIHYIQNGTALSPMASWVVYLGKFQFPITWLLGTIVFSILFTILPGTTLPLHTTIVSATYASLTWEVSKFLFSNYLLKLTRQNPISESISGLVFAVSWAYLFGLSLVLGICLAQALRTGPE